MAEFQEIMDFPPAPNSISTESSTERKRLRVKREVKTSSPAKLMQLMSYAALLHDI